jgi:hypothetical protein
MPVVVGLKSVVSLVLAMVCLECGGRGACMCVVARSGPYCVEFRLEVLGRSETEAGRAEHKPTFH